MQGPPSKPRRVANSGRDAMLLPCASQARALPLGAAARTSARYSSTFTVNALYTGFSSAGVDPGMNWLLRVALARPSHGTGMLMPPRSEERRVGNEGGQGGEAYDWTKNQDSTADRGSD